MASLTSFYNKLVTALAFLSGLMLVWLMIAVITSVLIRNLGIQSPAWLFTTTEYSIFYLTLLGSPWLIRERGHVYIEIGINRLPTKIRNTVSILTMLICVAISFTLAWKGLELFLSNVKNNDYDVRTYFIPTWIFTVTYPISFSLMGIEFSRFIFSKNNFHSPTNGSV